MLTEIQRATRRGGGLSVRALKESWKEAPAAIEELEKDNEVYVTRTLKDGQMRMVFWNEVKPDKADLDTAGESRQKGFQVEKGAHSFLHDQYTIIAESFPGIPRRVQRLMASTEGTE